MGCGIGFVCRTSLLPWMPWMWTWMRCESGPRGNPAAFGALGTVKMVGLLNTLGMEWLEWGGGSQELSSWRHVSSIYIIDWTLLPAGWSKPLARASKYLVPSWNSEAPQNGMGSWFSRGTLLFLLFFLRSMSAFNSCHRGFRHPTILHPILHPILKWKPHWHLLEVMRAIQICQWYKLILSNSTWVEFRHGSFTWFDRGVTFQMQWAAPAAPYIF